MTLALSAPATSRFWTDTPGFATLTLFMALAALPLLLAMVLDARQFQGTSVWLKPLKFHAALVIYVGTLALYARFLPEGMTATRGWRAYEAVVIAAVLAELVWIGGAAAFGVASHFNSASPVMAAIYPVMGLIAVTLTSASLVMGVAIWRNAQIDPTLRLALSLGLILTFVLTVLVAGRLAGGSGHHIGTPVTGAALPLMGWSREVGDLRVAHFLATHALHAVPLAGLLALWLPQTARTPAVWLAAAGFAALTLGTFVQALQGRPLI